MSNSEFRILNYNFFQRLGIFLFLLFVSGCSFRENLKNLDSRIGRTFFGEAVSQQNSAPGADSAQSDWRTLTDGQKEAIDQWLRDNGYNRYGDPKDMMYAGGTPLFDEASGEARDRYEYILEKIPNILGKIN